MTAIVILSALVGLNVAVKIISLCKILGINIEGYSQQDFEKLLEDPKFRKYIR